MPPKNKGKNKQPAKSRTPTLIDGLTKEELSKEQLEEHVMHLREELDREREERNYFQLERDKIHTFCEITNRQVEEVKAELRNLDKDIEDDKQRHQVELKVYKQKMKHLLCEHQNTISELKAGALISTEALHKELEQTETALRKKKRDVMVDLQEVDNENTFQDLELKYEEELTQTKKRLDKELIEFQGNCEKRLELHQRELDNVRKEEISERENEWNEHIISMKEDHNVVIHQACAAINSLLLDEGTTALDESFMSDAKQLLTEMAEKKKALHGVLKDNKHLTERLSQLQEEIDQIENKLSSSMMKSAKYDAGEKLKTKELQNLKSEYEALEQKFIELQQERDELYKTFTQNIQKVQDKGSARLHLLEGKVKGLAECLEKTQVQLGAVLSASNMDQTALAGVADKMEKNLDSRNNTLKNLQFQKTLISKARNDLLLTYEAKLRAHGVPVEELCVKPV